MSNYLIEISGKTGTSLKSKVELPMLSIFNVMHPSVEMYGLLGGFDIRMSQQN